MTRLHLRHSATAVTALVLATALLVAPLDAHTGLRRSRPAASASLVAPPRVIRLWFTERVALAVTSVRLVDSTGAESRLELTRDSTDTTAVVASVPGLLRPGRYLVIWQTGGRDGHPIRGRFHFTVLALPDSESSDTTAARVAAGGAFNATLDSMMRDAAPARVTGATEIAIDDAMEYRVARWVEFIGLLATVGAVAFYFLIAGGLTRAGFDLAARDAVDGVRQLGLAAVILTLASALARAHGEIRALSPDAAVTAATLRAVLAETTWGRGWWVGIAGAAVTMVGLLIARHRPLAWRVALVGAVMLVISPAMTGHAASTADRPWIALGVDAAHVTAAACWLGGLLALLVGGVPAVGRRPLDEQGLAASALLRRFHLVARVAVAVVLATGLITTAIRVRSIDALTHTSYGSLLLYKVFVFLFAATIGLYNWKKVLPRIAHHGGVARLRRSATVELLVATVILALTAALVAEESPDMQSRRIDHSNEVVAP